MSTAQSLQQAWPPPKNPVPIAIIGAGGIVNDAHMPAYRKAGFQVAGIFDENAHRAQLMERLDLHDVAGLVRFAVKVGLVTPEG